MPHTLRIARPAGDLARGESMYCRGLGLHVLGRFADHDGFDGVMLGWPGGQWHLEFTRRVSHPVAPTPTSEDLLVIYISDAAEWQRRCAEMAAAGFTRVVSLNPYWDVRGRTFADHDGYRVVLQNAAWTPDRGA